MDTPPDKYNDIEALVYECIASHNEMILVELINNLEKEYIELAKLSTFGEYESDWSHEDVLNYVTFNT